MLGDILKSEFIWWAELTEGEKKVIRDKREYPIFSVIKGMPNETRKEIYNSMRVKDVFSGVYGHTEAGWVSFFEDCYCEKHGITREELRRNCPESNKLKVDEATEFLCSALPERFKLYFAAKFRDEMDIIHLNDKTDAFFFQVDYYLRRNLN